MSLTVKMNLIPGENTTQTQDGVNSIFRRERGRRNSHPRFFLRTAGAARFRPAATGFPLRANGFMLPVLVLLAACICLPGNSSADDFQAGLKTYESGDYKAAFGIFSRLAEQGNVKAQCNAGLMLMRGEGTEQDSKAAAGWFAKAAEHGSAEARYNLAMAYSISGDDADKARAVELFARAAEQGMPEARHNLAVLCFKGEGTGRDITRAIRLFGQAAESGYADSAFCLGMMYLDGNGVPVDKAQAVKWFRRAGELGLPEAGHNIGCMYYRGDGVQKDENEAAGWFRMAADQGCGESQYNLGLILVKGPDTREQGIEYLRRAAGNGVREAGDYLRESGRNAN